MQEPTQSRQGDVLLDPVLSIPATATKVVTNKLIARGESSNHAHFADGDGVEVLEDTDGTLYVRASDDFNVQHLMESSGVWTKEHTPTPFAKGCYRYVPQREYDPYADAVREVLD